ncbi:MAG TPA: hypothetical protein VLF40_02660 [Candidatus Saccharimonadales bacterium]|nr:hypothetical protein [Candidatus Saccharimonadales bacterium]
MAIAFRNESHFIGTHASPITVSEPSGTVQNDILVYLYIGQSNVSGITQPTGWTTIYTANSFTPVFTYRLAYVVRGASAPSLTWSGWASSPYFEVYVLSFSGCDTSNPIDSSAQVTSDSGTNPDPPSTTAVSSSAMALAVGINWSGSSAGDGWTPPTGYTLRTDNTPANDGAIATKLLSSSGAENPSAYSGYSGGNTDRWSATVTLAPAATSTTIPWLRF